jgi:UDP-N-acetylmuramyl-tripeptide synthetase
MTKPLPLFHVTADSRSVKTGSIFVAIKGAKQDGHEFISAAFAAGAAQVYSELPHPDSRVISLGKNARKKLADLCSEAWGHPTRKLKMIGITGTSGKSTTADLVQHLLNAEGFHCARIGTNGFSFHGQQHETVNTTPDTETLHRYFAEVLSRGATHVVMEVSSHSLEQDRPWGIAWDVVAFLNLSPEHLDYHPSMDAYFRSKMKLFSDHLYASTLAGKKPLQLINVDHEWGKRAMTEHTTTSPDITLTNPISVSSQNEIQNVKDTLNGISGKIKLQEWMDFTCPLFGSFQQENILMAAKIASALNVTDATLIAALNTFPGVPGRMESIPNPHQLLVLVDYAHKPEALEKVLLSLQGKKIHTVVGCGGDRDPSKRPLMGAIAAKLSNQLTLTSDNPRTEDPDKILAAIEVGVKDALQNKSARIQTYRVEPNRSIAIRQAIQNANPGDVILIAGKGHETYQIIGSEKKHFDDREEARIALQKRPIHLKSPS